MSTRCLNCEVARYKLNELIQQYQQLLATKEQEILCSRRIIEELEQELIQVRRVFIENGAHAKSGEKESRRMLVEQQEMIQYLKQREVDLVEQLKETCKNIFKMDILDTKEKEALASPTKNTECNKQRNSWINLDRVFQESTISKVSGSDCKDKLKLKVAQDRLDLMNIKYKMALLKTVEVATLK